MAASRKKKPVEAELPEPVGEVTLVAKEVDVRETGEVIRYVPIAELRELGIIQEINRQLLHPIGMALAVTEDRIAGILDGRDDPEGMIFTDPSALKAWTFDQMFKDGCKVRQTALRFGIQPAYKKLERGDIAAGKMYRAKNAKWIDGKGFNDRVVIKTDGTWVTYTSYEVAKKGPQTIKMAVFLAWVKFEVKA